MRPYIGLVKLLVFVFLSVCVWRDYGCRNNPIRLKFATNIYVLYEIRCIVFGVHRPNIRNAQKYLNTLRLMEGKSLNFFFTWVLSKKCNDIYVVTGMQSRTPRLGSECTLPKLHVYMGTQKYICTFRFV